MKTAKTLMIVFFLFWLMNGCDDPATEDIDNPFSSNPSSNSVKDVGDEFDVNDHLMIPLDAVANDITINLFCGVWGCKWGEDEDAWQLGTKEVAQLTVPTEGDTTINEGQYFYHAYVRAAGFYTEVLEIKEAETITVDLDAVPQATQAIAGTVIATQYGYSPDVVDNADLFFTGPDGLEFKTTTDDFGRFGVKNLPEGFYSVVVESIWGQAGDTGAQTFEIEIGPGILYNDLVFPSLSQLD